MGLTFRRADRTAARRRGQDLPTMMVSCSVSARYSSDHVPMFSKILSFYKFLSRGLVFHVRVSTLALRMRLSTRMLTAPRLVLHFCYLTFSHQKLLPSVSKRGPGIDACGTSWWHCSPCVVASRTVPLGLWLGVCLVVWAFGLREGPEHRRPARNCCFLCHPCHPTPGVTAAA